MRKQIIVSLLVLLALPLLAEQQLDPSGHWEGVIRAPQMDVQIEVDLDGNRGTFGNPARGIRGFPLSDVAVAGEKISFVLKVDGGGSFAGTVAGKSMEGVFTTRTVDGKTVELPFGLTRISDPKVESVAASPAVAETLAGTWSGSLEAEGRTLALSLVIRNHQNGTASGVVTTNEKVEIALTRIAQKDAAVTFEVQSIGGAFEGTLTGNELAGTWTQGPFQAPITFRRKTSPVDEWAIAVGGRAKIAAVAATYREATIDVGGTRGTIRVWHTADGKYRKEEQIAGVDVVEIFDGSRGTLQQGHAAARAMTPAETERAKSQAFANWNAVFFAFFPERHPGALSVDADGTLILAPQRAVERRVTLDPKTALPATMTHTFAGRTIHVSFASYETVDGLRFEKEIRRSMGDSRYDSVIRFTKTIVNPQIEAALFAIND